MGKKISLDTAADELGVSKRTVRQLISDGVLPAFKVGRTSAVRIDADELPQVLRPITPNGKL
ncbi:excisionase family DNA-binding protein [Mycobacterium sp. 1465703.0]|uniref:excisionase family DNA-binding protein n=1 Tax=Mycobacterium sp. 1465703.0 TaxID=1834078 RepID=UPI0007FCF2B9|nr:excisionase family DNA-binding protein [Mycobacterium sp. 1465703.0]OBJ09667.1 hypothetical protein A5625_12640 [Mycobacterium sp. 1465703.0]